MILIFRNMTDERMKEILDFLDHAAFFSDRDGCRVVKIECAKCLREYEEKVEDARAKVVCRERLLCLKCDDEAAVPAFKGITVQIGFFSDG